MTDKTGANGATCQWVDWTVRAFGPPTCTATPTHTVYRSNGVQEIAEDYCRDHGVNVTSWYRDSDMEPIKAGAR